MGSRLWTNLRQSLSLGNVVPVEPLARTEPDYAREIAEFILRFKRCPRCHKLWSVLPQDLEFLTANPSLKSESYRTICQDGHRLFVTIFPSGTRDMHTQAQDEITAYLPRNCGPNRTIRTRWVSPTKDLRGGSELTFIRTCGLNSHDHTEYARYYEKPGWDIRQVYY